MPMAKAKKKTPEELFEVCNDVVNDYSERDLMLDNLEDYYFLEGSKEVHVTSEDDGVEVVRMPHAPNAIDLIQDLIAGTGVTISVPAPSEKTNDKKLADQAERFLKSLRWESEHQQELDIVALSAWYASMRGALCGRVMPMKRWLMESDVDDMDTDGKKGKKKKWEAKDRIPMQLQIRDPRYVYPRFGADGLACVVERWTRSVFDIRQTYGDTVLVGKRDTDEVKWTEYWDDQRYCYWADSEVMVKGKPQRAGPWPHTYGGNLYTYTFARQSGVVTKPEYRARPLLASLTHVIDRMDLLDSQEATALALYGGDALNVFSDELASQDANAEFKREVGIKPGDINYLRSTEKIEWLRAANRPPDFDRARAKWADQWSKGTFPDVMYGSDPGRSMSGYAVNLLNQSGQIRIRSIVTCLQRFLANLLSNALMLAENHICVLLDGPVPFNMYLTKEFEDGSRRAVRNREWFDATKLGGAYRVDVTVGDLMPSDEQVNLVLAERAIKGGILSWESSVAKWKLTDSPSDERSRIDREAAMNNPEIQRVKQAIVAASIMKELKDEAAELDIDLNAILNPPPPPQMPQLGAQGMPPLPPGVQGSMGMAMPEQQMIAGVTGGLPVEGSLGMSPPAELLAQGQMPYPPSTMPGMM
jgi:hypothetical protein